VTDKAGLIGEFSDDLDVDNGMALAPFDLLADIVALRAAASVVLRSDCRCLHDGFAV